MAADWIPMRLDLGDDPAVIAMSDSLQLDEFAVVGRLHKLWSWASAHTKDGRVNVTASRIDKLVTHSGFAHAMEAVGWIEITETHVLFVRWNRHNSQSAKKRAADAKRKKRVRNLSAKCPQDVRSEADKNRTTGQDRRVENKTEGLTPQPPGGGKRKRSKKPLSFDASKATIPESLNTPEFNAKWQEWCAYRRSVRKLISEKACGMQIEKLTRYGPVAAIEAINKAISNDYQGLFPEKASANGKQSASEHNQSAFDEVFGTETRNGGFFDDGEGPAEDASGTIPRITGPAG